MRRNSAPVPDNAADVAPVVMSVTAAEVKLAPMHEELRLLGTTVAMRHITLRAPAAGRVTGLHLESGDLRQDRPSGRACDQPRDRGG